MKKFLFFSALFLPNLGGVERYTFSLAKQLIKNQFDVTVVTSNTFSLPSQNTIDGIRVIRVPCINLLNGRYPFPKFNQEYRAIYRSLFQEDFDFVIVQTRFYVHSIIGARFAKKKHIPCIVIEHGTGHMTISNRFVDQIGAVYEHIETGILKRYCKIFYGVSQSCCEWLEHFHIQPKGILYNAVDIDDINLKYDHSVIDYKKMYAYDGYKIVSFAGRFVSEKGILELKNAIEQLNQDGQRVRLLLAGNGDLYSQLEREKNMNMVLLGKLDFDHMIALYKSSDIFCLPTKYPEGFPTTVLEAAACKCFVITTEKGGSKEFIINDEYGLIITDNSVEKIKASIVKAMDNAYRKKATEKAYSMLCEKFTWEKTCQHVISIEEKMKSHNSMN
ncbi:MAG: glycosyltransferase family 4 protein [Clostridia bacterium]|nr:glycosyltransferase family 4 protein [Clostridia bacterium]